MHVDLSTLILADAFVAAASGGFLVLAWLQNREAMEILWWAGGNLCLALAIPLLGSDAVIFGVPSSALGMLLLNVAPAMIWSASRACNDRRPMPGALYAGILVWLLAFGFVRHSPSIQIALNLGFVCICFMAGALELLRGQNDGLQARWPLVVLLSLHGLFFLIGTVESLAGSPPSFGGATPEGSSLINFETLFFVVGSAIFTVAMAKEKSELQHIAAARIDPLTGVANRRAFMEAAETHLRRCLTDDEPLSLILFDLDWFKSINDNFGHGTGDRVLQKFAQLARSSLRSTDFIGRPGGEEFAVLLPGSSKGAAYVVAERIRAAFAEACERMEDCQLHATVSAGVATAHPSSTIDSLMADGDRGLYHAKAEGRNRVAMADRKPVEPPPRIREPLVEAA